MIDSNQCTSQFDTTTTVFCQPHANALVTNGTCLGQITEFTNISSPISNMNFSWDFGDGNSTTSTDSTNIIFHEYSSCSTFSVNLYVSDDGNFCTDDTTIFVTIHCPPTASFLADPVCSGDTLFLIDNSTPGDGSIISWNWSNNIFNTIDNETRHILFLTHVII